MKLLFSNFEVWPQIKFSTNFYLYHVLYLLKNSVGEYWSFDSTASWAKLEMSGVWDTGKLKEKKARRGNSTR